jgi:hypothetical protein
MLSLHWEAGVQKVFHATAEIENSRETTASHLTVGQWFWKSIQRVGEFDKFPV